LLRRVMEAQPVRSIVDRIPERARTWAASVASGRALTPLAGRVRTHLHPGEPPEDAVLHGPVLRPLTSAVVTTLDTHQVVAETASAVMGRLRDAGVGFVLAPLLPRTPPQMVVRKVDADATCRALAEVARATGWYVAPLGSTRSSQQFRASETSIRSVLVGGGLRLFRYLADGGGRVLSGPEAGVEIQVWGPPGPSAGRDDDGTHPPGTLVPPTRNHWAPFLPPDAWQSAIESNGHRPAALRGPSVHTFAAPVDLVYTWVDSADPRWQERRALAQRGLTGEFHPAALDEARYQSVDELRYSLRSTFMYANWVRRIHVVTDGQIPHWLDRNHPKIRVVDHREILGDGPPVFNSHAIEAALHRIPDLAEHYLYLNDDVFFGRMAFPEDFFVRPGLARFFPSDLTIDPGAVRGDDPPIMAAAKNGRDVIARRFSTAVTQKIRHSVHPQLRDVLERIESDEPDLIAEVTRSAFRAPSDVSVASSLHHWYAYCLSRSVPTELDYLYLDIGSPHAPRTLDALLALRRFDTFCLNQERTSDRSADHLRLLTQFLERYFPLPAPWETRESPE
jgi:hypothetical protein